MAYMVALRTREFGTRIALGADPQRIAWWVITHGLAPKGQGASVCTNNPHVVVGTRPRTAAGVMKAISLSQSSPAEGAMPAAGLGWVRRVSAAQAILLTLVRSEA